MNVLASTGSSETVSASNILPSASRAPQRLSEATQSSAVTGVPSCHLRPSRRTNVHVSLSALLCQVSTICGLISPALFIANKVSNTCRANERVMFTVVACGSRIVTSDSSTTVRAFAARASRAPIRDVVASAAPPANAVRRPTPPLRMFALPHDAGQPSGVWQHAKRAGLFPVSHVSYTERPPTQRTWR